MCNILHMPTPDRVNPHPRSLLRDDVYTSIREAIVAGTFLPGEKLSDVELERWLGVSRTPIREALQRLARGGLVLTRPGRSTTVAPLDARATLHAQSVAGAMHELALREGVLHFGAADIESMRVANASFASALSRGDAESALVADDEFHDVAVRSAANPFIRDSLEVTTPLLRRVERIWFSTLAARSSVSQHERIIRFAAVGDAEGAALAARENWRTLEYLLLADTTEKTHQTESDKS